MAARGRPTNPDAKSAAQRAREYRERKRALDQVRQKIRDDAANLQAAVEAMRNDGFVRGQEARWMRASIAVAEKWWQARIEEIVRERVMWELERREAFREKTSFVEEQLETVRAQLRAARRTLKKHGINVTE